MNVLRWCPFVHLFDTPFQNSPYGHGYLLNHNSLSNQAWPIDRYKQGQEFVEIF